MRYCQSCGKEQDDDAVFCGNCGAKLDPIDADVEESTQEHSEEELASEKEAEQESTNTDDVASSADSTSVESASVGETTDAANRSSETTDKVQDALEAQKTQQAQQTQGAQPTQQTQGVPPTQQTESDIKGKGLSRNRLIGIIIAAIVVVIVVVIILVVALGGNSGPSDEQVRTDFEQNNSDFLQAQSVNMQYASDKDDDKEYHLADFTIDDRDDSGSYYRISFSGAKENASFRVEFSGAVDYENNGNGWIVKQDSFSTQEDKIIPIKGVGEFTPFKTGKSGFYLGDPDNYQVSDNYVVNKFESSDPVVETDGVYTTDATQDVTYNLGFGTETLTSKATFTFDSNSKDTKHWVEENDIPDVSNDVFTWKLSGRTFSLPDDNTLLNSYGTVSSSLTFNNISEDGNAEVNYTIDFLPSNSEVDSLGYVAQEVHLSGTATGTMQHKQAASRFDFEFTDASQNVTLSGTGEANYLTASVKTEKVYRKEVQLTIFPDDTLNLITATYVDSGSDEAATE